MTRDEFTAKHRPSQGCAPDQWEVEDAREKFGRDLAALLAATRAEALHDAARKMDDEAGWCVGGKRASDVIRAMVKP